MKQKTLISSHSISLVLIILAFIIFYAAYFLIYVPHQESLVEKRAFRILKAYAENMHNKFDYFNVHLENYSSYYLIRQPDTLIQGAEKDSAQNHLKNEQIKQLIANLDKTINTVSGELDNRIVRFKNVGGVYHLKFEGFKTAENLNIGSHQIAHLVPLTTFMENLKFDQLFDNIALICDTATLYNSNLDIIHDITNPGQLSKMVKQAQGGLITTINIRGEDNHVTILPINFLDKQLCLAGFIPAHVFRQKTRDINSEFMIILAGLLLLLLFSMPLLKIVFINRMEQLHARDATAAAISLFLGVGILILIVISITNYYVLDRHVHSKRIQAVSDTLYQNFESDVDYIKNLYAGILNDTVRNTGNDSKTHDDLIRRASIVFRNDTSKFELIPENYREDQLPLNEVFLIGDSGIIKSAISRTGMSDIVPINVSSRAYYKNIVEDSIKSWSYGPEKSKQRYFIESLKSYNSGEGEAAFSFRVPKQAKFSENILAITSPLPSMFSQVLPEEMRFLVIDEQGNVLFHSDQSKNLHENFLNESSYNARLKGAITHRIQDVLPVQYNEKQWLARVKPINDAPLYHVTLIDVRHKQDKNARVLVITFYFVFATFILILLGMMVIKIARIRIKNDKNKWFLSWLLFSKSKKSYYLLALIVQSLLLVFQFSGMFFDLKPLFMFNYQMVFIAFSVYFAILLFNINANRNEYRFVRIILFGAILLLSALLVYFFNDRFLLMLPVIVVVLMIQLSQSFWSGLARRISEHRLTYKVIKLNSNSIFRLYVFVWMISISCVPVLQYYTAIKKQEDQLWKYYHMEHIARKNLELTKHFDFKQIKSRWFNRINGSGIDYINIKWIDTIPPYSKKVKLNVADRFYASLPDPLTKGIHLVGLLDSSNFHNEWSYRTNRKDPTDSVQFSYSRPGYDGSVCVSMGDRNNDNNILFWLIFIIPGFFVFVLLWVTFRYVINIVLRSGNFEFKSPQTNWDEIIHDDNIKHILLISLREKPYQLVGLKATIGQSEVIQPEIREYTIDMLPETSENARKQNTQSIIWLSGLGEVIKDPKALENALAKLNSFIQKTNDKLVIHLPFGFDFVEEYYQNTFNGNKSNEPSATDLKSLKNKLEAMFKDFYLFVGNTIFCKRENTNISNLQYLNIWQNLSNLEKLVLNDLSDDTMLNYKNTSTINQLLSKGVIRLDPEPCLFAESFDDFISNSVDPEEGKLIRAAFAKKGNWRNKRYLILLILIPLLLFIFIVQGTSIEKVLAISMGGLAVISGIVRLFDSDIFKQTSTLK